MQPHLSLVQYIMSYVAMQRLCIAAFGGSQAKLQQIEVVVCCLVSKNFVGSPVYIVEAHNETAETALFLYSLLQLQLAWLTLSCVYCTRRVPGCFFRHEISDLLHIVPFVEVLPAQLLTVVLPYVWVADRTRDKLTSTTYASFVSLSTYSGKNFFLLAVTYILGGNTPTSMFAGSQSRCATGGLKICMKTGA